jgi:hypothetical protein
LEELIGLAQNSLENRNAVSPGSPKTKKGSIPKNNLQLVPLSEVIVLG